MSISDYPVKQSIKHWKRLIKWAEKQNPSEKKKMDSMSSSIGECWAGGDCPLCQAFSRKNENNYYTCTICPLKKNIGSCNDNYEYSDNKNNWYKVNNSKTWADWIIQAKIMLEQLRSL